MHPKLDKATEADLPKGQQALVQAKARYDEAMRDWKFDSAEWKRTGGYDQDFQFVFELTRWGQYMHYREGFGDGGAQSDTSGHCQHLGLWPAKYAASYRLCFDEDVSPFPDITHFLPRRVFANLYPAKGPLVTQMINGPNDPLPEYFISHYPIVPDAWKPAILWAWNRTREINSPADAHKALCRMVTNCSTYTFLHYPLDPKTSKTEIEPKSPQGIMPLAWEASDFGYYAFRDKWQDEKDFLVQFYGPHPCRPWLLHAQRRSYMFDGTGPQMV